jgi:hypothetical protein
LKARFLTGLTLAALAILAIALSSRTAFVAGGSDSSGYLNAAKLFSEGRIVERVEPLARFGLPDSLAGVFTPLGFAPGPRPGTMAPTYPPGLPLHMAAAALLGGWARAPFLIPPIASVFCLWLMFLLGRELGLSRWLAVAGAAILGLFPTFLTYSLQSMSDVPGTAWALAAVLSALRARRSPKFALLAGAAFGVAVLVRPTNALLLAAVLVALPWRTGVFGKFLVGGLPFAVFLFVYNAAAFGSPLRTGYGSLSGHMALTNFGHDIRVHAYWLAVLFSPLVPLGFLASATNRRVPIRDRSLLVAWFASFFFFYGFYELYEDWLATRFLLPGLPAMIAGALLVARDWLGPPSGDAEARAPRRLRLAACLVMLGVVLGLSAWNVQRFDVLEAWRGEEVYPEACRFVEASVPGTAVVASMQMTGALRYYTALTFARWDWIDPRRFQVLRDQVEARGGRWYALVAPFERGGLERNLPGRWTQIGNRREYALLRLEPSSPSNTAGAGVP